MRSALLLLAVTAASASAQVPSQEPTLGARVYGALIDLDGEARDTSDEIDSGLAWLGLVANL